jgi:hypothetical protein
LLVQEVGDFTPAAHAAVVPVGARLCQRGAGFVLAANRIELAVGEHRRGGGAHVVNHELRAAQRCFVVDVVRRERAAHCLQVLGGAGQ